MKTLAILASAPQSLMNFRGQLIIDFVNKGFEVVAIAPKLNQAIETKAWLEARSVTCIDAPFDRAGLNPIRDLIALFKLWALFRKLQPNVFIGYTIKPVIWGGLAAWFAGVEKRVALVTGLGYAFTGEARGKRALIQKLARSLYKASLSRMHHIFFQNPDDVKDFQQHGVLGNKLKPIVVNGSGVDVNSFSSSPLPEHPLKFLLIARLLADKGIREYADAAAKVKASNPEVEFHLVGGLDENPTALSREEVEKWQANGILAWHDHQSDVKPYLINCHVFVLPSYREGTPRSVLEAMATGRAIITTDAPGCRETVINGENGFLVPVQDSKALSEAMLQIISNDYILRAMGAKSREIAEGKYDVHKVNRAMMDEMGF